ncbi:MAG: ABC transporter ATP-binding protein/permease [Nitrospirota bacterium]|nr:ABC transporter ATP-binding protein/permease [Nitrospirota bacterium]MDH5768369.1 ABC transporter ATP-binding protein/permease [Nitrospirota bacterium]
MEALKRIIKLVQPYWGRVVLAGILSLIISGINGGLAWLVKPALDGIFFEKNETLLIIMPLAVLVLFLLRGSFFFCQSYLMRSIGAKIVRDMRNRLFGHLMYLPVGYYKKESTGSTLSRITNDIGILQNLLAYSIKDLFVESATVVALLAVAFYRRWDLALMAITVFPAALYGVGRIGKRLKNVSIKAQQKISIITEHLTESFAGIKMIKVFGREGDTVNRFKDKNQDFYRETMRSVRLIELTSLLMEVVGGLGIAFVIWYGGRLVVTGTMTPGEFFSFLTAIFMVYTPAKRLSNVNNGIQQARASLERISEIENKEQEKDGKVIILPIKEAIEFRNVSFVYPGVRHEALKDITLKVKKGEIVAIVGKSGVGKTTLVDLLPRFHDPSGGSIYVDGVDISEASLKSLRGQIGVVSQDIILFNDIVRNNIVFGKPDADEDEIVNAAKSAFAHEFIIEFPQRYETIIGEGGVRLSGGERQRISIARAILKNPPILILDEATSSLDTHSEMMVQKALGNLMENRTTFVIAHRLSTIRRATKIVVLDKGRIVETGTHDELIERGGIYKKLYELQFSAQEVDISLL